MAYIKFHHVSLSLLLFLQPWQLHQQGSSMHLLALLSFPLLSSQRLHLQPQPYSLLVLRVFQRLLLLYWLSQALVLEVETA